MIDGTASYRERIALPPTAVFEATLEDVSRAGAAAEVLGDVRVEGPLGSPIRFSIPYDPRHIDARHRYAVRARIVDDGRLLLASDTHHPVITDGAPTTVDLLLRRVPSAAVTAGVSTLHGLYTYMADAGWFTECDGGRRLPVAQEGDNAALEAAYVGHAHSPGQALHVTVEGRIEEREPMEGAPRPTLIVDRFIGISDTSCASGGEASLENTYWKVMQIRGTPVMVAERQREPYVILHPADRRVSGYGGCNALTGGYVLDGDRISFTQMAGTMMACAEGMEQERALHDALGSVASARITGKRLELLDAQGMAVLLLESRYLK